MDGELLLHLDVTDAIRERWDDGLVRHPWRKHFCDAWFIVMEETSVMIILVMSWNTSMIAQVWLSWLCHKFFMDVHAWQKSDPLWQTRIITEVYIFVVLHGNISQNGYGNAIIGRYGGCFDEDIKRFMCDRAYHITGFGCTGEVCTNSQCEKGQCTVPKRLAMMQGWECV